MDLKDPMNMFTSKPRGFGSIVKAITTRKHEEADLHLAFCRWVRLQYPKLEFIRHEREKKRTPFMQNLFKMYNSANDKMPDFELLYPSGKWHRLYIEFKKPGEKVTLKDGITIKPEYADQYKRHVAFWAQDSCAYFCNDLQMARIYLNKYICGEPMPMQVYSTVDDKTYLPFQP